MTEAPHPADELHTAAIDRRIHQLLWGPPTAASVLCLIALSLAGFSGASGDGDVVLDGPTATLIVCLIVGTAMLLALRGYWQWAISRYQHLTNPETPHDDNATAAGADVDRPTGFATTFADRLTTSLNWSFIAHCVASIGATVWTITTGTALGWTLLTGALGIAVPGQAWFALRFVVARTARLVTTSP